MSRNQQVSTKFTSISRLSGEVTAALSALDAPSAVEAYERIQAVETAAVAAATAQQAAAEATSEASAKLDAARKHVRLINAACVNICAVQGIGSAEHFTVMDKGDDAGLARRLEPEIRKVAGYGPALADALGMMVRDLTSAEVAANRAKSAQTMAERDLDSAILNLQGVVAQGRAVLATFGIKTNRKPAKKKTTATSGTPAPKPSPEVTLVPAVA